MGRPEDEHPRGSENPDPDDESARRPLNPDGGEDESSSADEGGNDDHLHEDQKPIARSSMSGTGAVKAPAEMSAEELGRLARAERDAGVPDLPTAKAAVEAAQREKEEAPD